MKLVYVVSKDGKPLMPTKRYGKVRYMLRSEKAEIISYEPFTIRLLYDTSGYIQKVILGIDTGSKNIGLCGVSEKGIVLYEAQVALREDIKGNIDTKRALRRGRRYRKTRYRKARFLNRRKAKGWLPPSLKSRLESHINLAKKISSFLPVTKIIAEAGQFDVQAIVNPDINGIEYQEGEMKGFDSVKEYVKIRDNYTCHYKELRPDITCSERLEVDHLIPRSSGGTDRPSNLVCSCENHNKAKSNLTYKEFTGKDKPLIKSFKETVFMNILKDYLIPELNKIAPSYYTYGLYTRRLRKKWGLDKSHINDALAITKIKPLSIFSDVYIIRQVRKKKRSLHETIPRKGRKFPNINQTRNSKNTKYIIHKGLEWSLWDKVYIEKLNKTGFITGFSGKMVYLQDIDGNYLQISDKYKQISTENIRLLSRNNNYIFAINEMESN